MPSKEESEQMFAFDVPRLFANQVQSLTNASFTMMVFRETAITAGQAAIKLGETMPLTRNIVSVILPTDVALEAARNLVAILEEKEADPIAPMPTGSDIQ